ncbi:Macrophage mannose receptor 1 [Nymphon striatum]|nr:Macrophage mannose receptor 1 [Nymphon striatum]
MLCNRLALGVLLTNSLFFTILLGSLGQAQNITISSNVTTNATFCTYSRCSPDWSSFKDQMCYKSFEAEETYGAAGERCRSVGGNLLSITNTDKLNFITSLVLITSAKSNGFWIGLRELETTGKFMWNDGSEVTVSNWSPNMPNKNPGDSYKCAYIEGNSKVDNTTAWQWGCYWVEGTPQTFDSGVTACSSKSGKPVWFENSAEFNYVKSMIGATGKTYWTGLQRRNSLFGAFLWSDDTNLRLPLSEMHISATLRNSLGAVVKETKLVRGGDGGGGGGGGCMKLKNLLEKVGRYDDYWIGLSSTEKAGEYATRAPPTTLAPPTFYKCEGMSAEWVSMNGFCYYVTKSSSEKLDWHAARTFCRNNHGEMASLHSQAENDFLLRLIRKNPISLASVWIGLNSLGIENDFSWSDQSALNFVHWDSNPTEYGQERCGVMVEPTGEWDQNHCSKNYHFACKKIEGATSVRMVHTPPPIPGHCPSSWREFGKKI